MARPDDSDPYGKRNERLETVVPLAVKDDFTALERLRRKTVSEYLREVVLRHVYGELAHMQRLIDARAEGDPNNPR